MPAARRMSSAEDMVGIVLIRSCRRLVGLPPQALSPCRSRRVGPDTLGADTCLQHGRSRDASSIDLATTGCRFDGRVHAAMADHAGIAHAITQIATERSAEPGSRTDVVRASVIRQSADERCKSRCPHEAFRRTHDRFPDRCRSHSAAFRGQYDQEGDFLPGAIRGARCYVTAERLRRPARVQHAGL